MKSSSPIVRREKPQWVTGVVVSSILHMGEGFPGSLRTAPGVLWEEMQRSELAEVQYASRGPAVSAPSSPPEPTSLHSCRPMYK